MSDETQTPELRRSARLNKSKLPEYLADFNMGGGSNDEEELDNTIIENNESSNAQLLQAFKEMQLKIDEMQKNLDAERNERKRLESELMNSTSSSSHSQKSAVITPQPIITGGKSPHQNPELPQPTTPISQSSMIQPPPPPSQSSTPPSSNIQQTPPNPQLLSNQQLPPNPQLQSNLQLPANPQLPSYNFQQPQFNVQTSSSQLQQNALFQRNSSAASDQQSFLTGARKKIIDLPSFSGRPEEWPSFHVAFVESNNHMLYSNWENHLRLNKALTGIAKESVQALLIHPDNVELVINELHRQFGQSQHLLRSQLDNVRRIQSVQENRLELLIPFATKVRNLAAFLETINSLPHLANPNLIEELVQKLPPSKRIDWGMHAVLIKPYVTVRHFSDWLSNLAYVISTITATNTISSDNTSYKKKPRELMHASIGRLPLSCLICEQPHRLVECEDFLKKTIEERWIFVKDCRLCFTCLRERHTTATCRSRKRCNIDGCPRFHHPCLHENTTRQLRELEPVIHPIANHGHHGAINCAKEKSSEDAEVLFKIIPVRLYGPNQRHLDTFAMIDEGSSVTLVDESILQELQLQGHPEQLTLQWFGKKTSSEVSQCVDIEISGIGLNDSKYKMNGVRTVRSIDLPLQTLKITELQDQFRVIKKLPIAQYENAKPLVLIGLNHSFLGAPMKSLGAVGKCWNGPIAVKTKLGWVVYGPREVGNSSVDARCFHINAPSTTKEDVNLEKTIEDYFSLENFGVQIAKLESEADRRANILLKSTTRKLGGRFQTGLLWKNNQDILPSSYGMAKRRFMAIERKFKGNPAFKMKYTEMMNNNLTKGYARKLSKEEASIITKKTWYLPHFATSNPNKPGKYRLVFDAAAKVNGLCLNDFLMKGPDLYNSMVDVLINFRLGSVAVIADIEEMFSQVLIQPSDTQAQRFLWRNEESDELEEYVMDVMTFGVTCSPSSAHYVKNANATLFLSTHPKAVNSIISHHYVDDFADSFDDVGEAIKVASDVKMIHRNAGFNLRRFTSNHQEVSNFLNGCQSQENVINLDLEAISGEKILGLIWDTKDDCFKFNLQFSRVPKDVVNGTRSPTKRELISFIMSVFDPFGFLADIMVHSKVIMQQLWRCNVGWDEAIPEAIDVKWTQWREELVKVKQFTVPRHYFTGCSQVIDIQMHTFVDASQDAYSAATYIRIFDGNSIAVQFVMGKSRCSPIKKLLSIPRLELQSAVLGTRLCSTAMESNKFQISKRFFWSDSATVISWIKSDMRQYKPFVAHRISEIIESTSPSEWSWISTKLNVADKATRANFPINYNPDGPWKNGPDFLHQSETEWPLKASNMCKPTNEEMKPKFVNVTTKQFIQLIDLTKYSSLLKVKRIVAWICRFINNKCKSQQNCLKGELLTSELQNAEVLLCKMVQKGAFQKELDDLRQGVNVGRSSNIYKLTPILDESGVIRLNGRIRRSLVVTESAKQPIILPKDHAFTKLVVHYYHQKMKHQNVKTIVNEIQQHFWIPGVKSVVNKVRRECLICKIRSARPKEPIMGELPFDRVNAFVRPFTYTGLDYFGPYYVTIGRRTEKRWVALFTCMTVRAVHLELAENMTTDSCLLCIRNFVNRRGVPIRIRSDNGTNFTGASKEIQDAINNLDHDRITSELTANNIEWKFNCPENPHAGGCWERLVQSVKKVLSYTLHEESPKVETLRSLLIEAECIVNSRPLTEIALSHEDEYPLTPNHFLLGTMNSTQTPGSDDGKVWCLRKQWRISQQLKNRFWKKWISDYLPTLICRPKWFSKVNPIKVGDVVLICERDISSNKFIKGLVIEVFPGADGQVRSAKVKTSSGVLKRPATKLAVLDIMDGESARSSNQPGAFTGGGVVAESISIHPKA